ncbi:MAG: hypothetical protein WBA76_20665 [Phormidesmis sp.]
MYRTQAKSQAKAKSRSNAATAAAINYADKNPLVLKWMACNLAAAIVALLPMPTAPYAGAAIAGGVNAGFAVSATSRKRIEAAERAEQVDRSKFEADMKRLDADKAAIAQAHRDIDKQNAQLIAVEGSLKTQQLTMRDRMMVEAQKEAQAKVDAMQARLDIALADKAAMQATYQEKSTEMAKKTGLIVSKVQKSHKDLGDCAAQTIATGNEVLAKERQQTNAVLEGLSRDIKVLTAELGTHKALVAKLQAPKQFKFKSLEADTGNSIQKLLADGGLHMSCDSIGRIHYGSTPIYFEPINCTASQVEKELERVQTALGLPELPTAKLIDGKIEIVVQLTKEQAPKEQMQILNPPLSKLEKAIDESVHVRIAAPTKSGKSTLLGNIANYIVNTHESTYELFDPKVTKGKIWGALTPTHYGLECVDPFFELAEACLDRIRIAADAARRKAPEPDFKKSFHIVDELELLYGLGEISEDKKHTAAAFKRNCKIMLKVGREHKLKFLFVTQSPLPSVLNLNKDDLYNTSSIFLGKCIADALDSELLTRDISREKLAKLKAEYRARLQRNDEYIFLFYNPAEPDSAWFGICPDEHYMSQFIEPAQKTKPNENPAFGGSAPSTKNAVLTSEKAETLASQSAPVSTKNGAESASTEPAPTAPNQHSASTELARKLKQGTHCPSCTHHSATYKRKTPTKKGEVTVTCKTPGCESGGSFKWKVI